MVTAAKRVFEALGWAFGVSAVWFVLCFLGLVATKTHVESPHLVALSVAVGFTIVKLGGRSFVAYAWLLLSEVVAVAATVAAVSGPSPFFGLYLAAAIRAHAYLPGKHMGLLSNLVLLVVVFGGFTAFGFRPDLGYGLAVAGSAFFAGITRLKLLDDPSEHASARP
ncbi:MAG: hypothetical protein ACP5NF_04800 [Thermoanaerobaculum sp.]